MVEHENEEDGRREEAVIEWRKEDGFPGGGTMDIYVLENDRQDTLEQEHMVVRCSRTRA